MLAILYYNFVQCLFKFIVPILTRKERIIMKKSNEILGQYFNKSQLKVIYTAVTQYYFYFYF